MPGPHASARFEVIRQLGSGGMGVVYEARDRERDCRVALKALRTTTPELLVRLKREFRALQDLSHPNLVSLGELHEEAGSWYFTMELVDGVPLLEHLRDRDPARIRAAFAQIAAGLSALHEADKVHRDVKPSNVMVTAQGRVVILDFGLVTAAGQLSLASRDQIIGTIAYMAPEQAAGQPLGPAADWYSVGAMLYEALTGVLPFDGTPVEILMHKQQIEPPPPSAHAADVPEDLDQLCADLLRIDPALRPDGRELRARLGDARRGRSSTAPSTPTQTPVFVGRVAELAALRAALDDTREAGIAVIVEGESGVGKSALVRELADGAVAARGAAVLFGRCYERESVPYKAFDGVVDALAAMLEALPEDELAGLVPANAALLAHVFPVLARIELLAGAPRPPTTDPHHLRALTFAALRDLLAAIAQRRPLIVVIDDLQWADADSLALLREVLQPPGEPRLLLLATWRRVAGAGERPELPAATRALVVEGLAPADARELAGELLRRAGAEATRAAAIAGEASGHPLFIDELARHAAVHPQAAMPRVEEAIGARVDRLDPIGRRIVELAAVAAAPLDQATLAAAVGIDAVALRRQLGALRVLNLARSSGDRVEAFHDRVRAAVVARLDAEQVRGAHRAIARAIERTGRRDLEALAVHYHAAGEPAAAARYAARAAAEAADALAFDRAARLYRLALELHDGPPATARPLQVALGDALANAGRLTDAAEAYLQAAEGADAAARLEYRRRAGEQLLFGGQVERGLAEIAAVLAEVGFALPRTPRRALASLLWHRLRLRLRGLRWTERDASELSPAQLQQLETYKALALGLGMVDNIRGAQFQARGLRLALATGERMHVARSLGLEAVYRSTAGPSARPRVSPLLDETARIAEACGDPVLRAISTGSAGVCDYLSGRWAEAAERLRVAARAVSEETTGAFWEINHTRVFLLMTLRNLGELGELRERFDAYMLDARRRGDGFFEPMVTRAINVAWLVGDEPARARAELDRHADATHETGFLHMRYWYELRARGELALYEGYALDPSGDEALIEGSLLRRIQILRNELWWLCARLALARGDVRAAAARARRLARSDAAYARAWGACVRAGIAEAGGRREDAAARWRDAADAAAACGMALVRTVALRRRAELRGDGDAVAAADEWMREHGVAAPARMARVVAPPVTSRRLASGSAGAPASRSDPSS